MALLSPAKARELENRFSYHPPDPDQSRRYEDLRDQFHDLAKLICALTPESKEQTRALEYLESAMFYANASIARNE